MTSIRVSLTILCALSLAFALPVTAQTTCPTRCGITNVAVGIDALHNNTGDFNTATGRNALSSNTTGISNTATGTDTLARNTTGGQNTAFGRAALNNSTTASNNIAIGAGAGVNLTTGNNNIHIGNDGDAADSDLIRIGTAGDQTRTFIAGIFGANVLNGTPVEVDRNGQLGIVLSSRRAKDDIRDMEEASGGLAKLRPDTFRDKAEPANGSRPLEYGLIAEEVAEIYPELVVRDTDGQPAGVRYHVLPAMLLNELQRQQRQLDTQERLIDELTARLSRLEAKGAAAGR